MAAPLVFQVAKRLLRDLGVTALSPSVPQGQPSPIERGDKEDIAQIMSAAFQEIYDDGPLEMSQRPGSCYLHAPIAVTFTATQGSNTVSAVTTYASWMEGCTLRCDGDGQDNELINATTLARPYTGTTGSTAGTVYADAYSFDDTIQHIMEPVFCGNAQALQWPIMMAGDAEEFARVGGWPPLSGDNSSFGAGGLSQWWYGFSRKSIGNRPFAWLADAYYDPTLAYLKRRIRFAPIPTEQLSIGFTASHNPPRITADQIVEGGTALLPIPNGWVESIYIPICRQLLTGHGLFTAENSKGEIMRAYSKAKARLVNSRGAKGEEFATYWGR